MPKIIFGILTFLFCTNLFAQGFQNAFDADIESCYRNANDSCRDGVDLENMKKNLHQVSVNNACSMASLWSCTISRLGDVDEENGKYKDVNFSAQDKIYLEKMKEFEVELAALRKLLIHDISKSTIDFENNEYNQFVIAQCINNEFLPSNLTDFISSSLVDLIKNENCQKQKTQGEEAFCSCVKSSIERTSDGRAFSVYQKLTCADVNTLISQKNENDIKKNLEKNIDISRKIYKTIKSGGVQNLGEHSAMCLPGQRGALLKKLVKNNHCSEKAVKAIEETSDKHYLLSQDNRLMEADYAVYKLYKDNHKGTQITSFVDFMEFASQQRENMKSPSIFKETHEDLVKNYNELIKKQPKALENYSMALGMTLSGYSNGENYVNPMSKADPEHVFKVLSFQSSLSNFLNYSEDPAVMYQNALNAADYTIDFNDKQTLVDYDSLGQLVYNVLHTCGVPPRVCQFSNSDKKNLLVLLRDDNSTSEIPSLWEKLNQGKISDLELTSLISNAATHKGASPFPFDFKLSTSMSTPQALAKDIKQSAMNNFKKNAEVLERACAEIVEDTIQICKDIDNNTVSHFQNLNELDKFDFTNSDISDSEARINAEVMFCNEKDPSHFGTPETCVGQNLSENSTDTKSALTKLSKDIQGEINAKSSTYDLSLDFVVLADHYNSITENSMWLAMTGQMAYLKPESSKTVMSEKTSVNQEIGDNDSSNDIGDIDIAMMTEVQSITITNSASRSPASLETTSTGQTLNTSVYNTAGLDSNNLPTYATMVSNWKVGDPDPYSYDFDGIRWDDEVDEKNNDKGESVVKSDPRPSVDPEPQNKTVATIEKVDTLNNEEKSLINNEDEDQTSVFEDEVNDEDSKSLANVNEEKTSETEMENRSSIGLNRTSTSVATANRSTSYLGELSTLSDEQRAIRQTQFQQRKLEYNQLLEELANVRQSISEITDPKRTDLAQLPAQEKSEAIQKMLDQIKVIEQKINANSIDQQQTQIDLEIAELEKDILDSKLKSESQVNPTTVQQVSPSTKTAKEIKKDIQNEVAQHTQTQQANRRPATSSLKSGYIPSTSNSTYQNADNSVQFTLNNLNNNTNEVVILDPRKNPDSKGIVSTYIENNKQKVVLAKVTDTLYRQYLFDEFGNAVRDENNEVDYVLRALNGENELVLLDEQMLNEIKEEIKEIALVEPAIETRVRRYQAIKSNIEQNR